MTKSRCFFAFVIVAFWIAQLWGQRADGPGSEPATVIEGATIIDSVSSGPIEDAVMVLEGKTIRAVGKRGSVRVPANARRVNMAGKTIMPGILDLHTHMGNVAPSQGPPSPDVVRAAIQRDVNRLLYYGVTHAISLGIDGDPMRAFLADQRAGKTTGAYALSAGYGFAAKGGWQPNLPNALNLHRPTTPGEARQIVREEIAKGVDLVKVWVDDRLGELPKFNPEMYGAIIDESHKRGKKVASHMFYLEDAKELMRQGVDILAHSVRDKEVDDEFLRLAKQKGVTQIAGLVGHSAGSVYAERPAFLDDPGLALMYPKSLLDMLGNQENQQKVASNPALAKTREQYAVAQKNAAKEAAYGIPLAIGTDAGGQGNFQGLWDHREMELLVQAGIPPMQAIRAATINGAKFLGLEKQYGTLQPGKIANFIVLTANPLSAITNSRKIEAVWLNGSPMDREALARQAALP